MKSQQASIIFICFTLVFISHVQADIDIVNCPSDTACTIKIYRSECPVLMSLYDIEIDSIQADNFVEIRYDGAVNTVLCDGSWQSIHTASNRIELENRIACTIADDRQSITANLELYDQATYDNVYSTIPSESGYPELSGIMAAAPYCEQETSPDTASVCKWQVEENGGWLVFARTTVDNIKIGFFEAESPEPMPDNLCAKDVNNNGSIESSEYGLCATTDEGDLCLVDAVLCIENTVDAMCPTGGTLDGTTDVCEASSVDSCTDSGNAYDAVLDRCIGDPVCSDSGVYSSLEDRCEIVITSDICPTGYAYDGSLNACLKTPACPDGGIYNPSQDNCRLDIMPSCPEEYTLNTGLNVCLVAPSCPDGSTYNSAFNLCMEAADLVCPDAYTRNGNICYQEPSCSNGGTYNPANKRCEVALAYQCPADDQVYTDNDVCNTSCFTIGTCTATVASEEVTEYCWDIFIEDADCQSLLVHCPFPSNPVCLWYHSIWDADDITDTTAEYVGTCRDNGKSDYVLLFEGSGVGNSWGFGCNQIWGRINQTNTYECSISGTGFDTISSCENNCSQTQSCNTQCPSGYTQAGSLCIANPTCDGGGSFSPDDDRCEVNLVSSCGQGFSYDAASGHCIMDACPSGGILNSTTGQCHISISQSCPDQYAIYNTTCTSPPVCDAGIYDAVSNQCRVSAASLCPSDYTVNDTGEICLKEAGCDDGATLSSSLDQCVMDADHDCPEGYGYTQASRQCESYPICTSGAYRPESDDCFDGYGCPYGDEYACLPYQDDYFCNDSPCVNVDPTEVIDLESPEEEEGAQDKEDDGEIDPDTGECLENVYFFNGHDNRCRSDGATITWDSCCKDDDYLFGMLQCDEDELELGEKKSQGLCYYIGEYCSKEYDLVVATVCVEYKKTYCCFESKLGRMIQEQGRAQLKDSSTDWGTPKSPNCRGLSPGELQMLDYSEISFDEYYPDIQVDTESQMNDTMSDGLNQYLDGEDTKGSLQE